MSSLLESKQYLQFMYSLYITLSKGLFTQAIFVVQLNAIFVVLKVHVYFVNKAVRLLKSETATQSHHAS